MSDPLNSPGGSTSRDIFQFSICKFLGVTACIAIVLGLLEWSGRGFNPFILGASGPIGALLSLLRKPRRFETAIANAAILSTVTWAALPAYIALTSMIDARHEPTWVPPIHATMHFAICGAYLGGVGGAVTAVAWLFLCAIVPGRLLGRGAKAGDIGEARTDGQVNARGLRQGGPP